MNRTEVYVTVRLPRREVLLLKLLAARAECWDASERLAAAERRALGIRAQFDAPGAIASAARGASWT